MKQRTRWTGRRIAALLGLSLAVNFLLVVAFDATMKGWGRGPLPDELSWPSEPIDVSMIEPSALSPYASRPDLAAEQAAAEKKVEEARKPEEDPSQSGQVVDTAKPAVEIRPEKANYLGEFDNKVEHETKGKPGDGKAGAREPHREVASVAPPSHAAPPRPPVPEVAPQAPARGESGAGGKGALAMREPTRATPDQPRGKEDGLDKTSEDGTEAAKGAGAPSEAPRGLAGESQPGRAGQKGQEATPGAPETPPRTSDLRPSDEVLAQAVGAGSNDYLKDVDEGSETLLNTKRWRYWSFFSRVKHGVSQTWRPDSAYRLRDPTGQIYGHKNRFTVLKVSLRPDGSLRDVMVEKPCGVDFLDDEAVTAFREAQPFPNPPEGLVDPSSHLITFRFGFYFEITGSPTFRIFRQ